MKPPTVTSAREYAVAFENAAGQTLHGVLHLPATRARSPLGVILLTPGQQCRIGPWRSYVRLARRLTGLGVPVLRFDFHGLGDSDGEHPHGQLLVDLYGFVQSGGFVDDVRAAARFFAREAGVSRFVFAGLCGGATTGLLAATSIPGIYGHALLDLRVTEMSAARQRHLETNAAELLRARPATAPAVLRGYVARALDAGAWRRLLTGGSDYALIREVVTRVGLQAAQRASERLPGRLRAWIAPRLAPRAAPATPARAEKRGAADVPHRPTIDAFHAARALGQRAFFLNSSAEHPLFETYFAASELPRDLAAERGLGLRVVPDANHGFSSEDSQRALLDTVEAFVREALAEVSVPNVHAATVPAASREGASLAL